MYVPFESLSPHSRIWIYQSDKKFITADKNIISEALKTFTEEWAVHGQPMKTSFDIRHGQFVILAADDQTSGCSIDSSVRVIKSLGQSLGVDFFNRNLVAFLKDQEIQLTLINDLKRKLEEGSWDQDTFTFNNLVDKKYELDNGWLVPAHLTWLKRYFPNKTVTF